VFGVFLVYIISVWRVLGLYYKCLACSWSILQVFGVFLVYIISVWRVLGLYYKCLTCSWSIL